MSRTRVLLALALLVAGCSSPAPAAPGAGTPVSGGSLTFAVETEPITFNPHLYAQAKARLLVWNSFDALIAHDDKGGYVPWLATGYDVAADGLAYTFHLRTGVTFADGEKFDANAVKANLDQLFVTGYAPSVTAVQLRNFKDAQVVDPQTIVVHLKAPDVLVLDFFASPQGGQISPKSLREAKNLKAGGVDVVGTGPFVLDRYQPGQEVHYHRNPAYNWAPATAKHQGPAYLDEVTYRFLKESSVRVGALTSGQAQVVEGVPATDQDLISANSHLALNRQLNAGTAYSYYLNVTHAPFDDIRVRRAFQDAVDVDTVLKSVYRGTATRAWSVVGPASPFYDKSLEKAYGNDAAAANKLLDEAGWTQRDADGFRTKNGQRLTVRLVQSAPFVRDRRDILAQAVQAAVKQSAGIDLKVSLVDQATANQALQTNQYEVFDNSRLDTDAGTALNLLLASSGAINRGQYKDPHLDQLLVDGQSSTDLAKRTAVYAQVQKLTVVDQAVILPLYAPQDQVAATDSVGGTGFEVAAGVPASAYGLWVAK
ncbi:ABC transporter substrate-binding protein [Hamadaea tsunoensis]|uniref:ABC transporter substrate-binding protein n=1 Tax=Hamadaea tsunoensis TaxID=53368 RepID=UPI00040808BE|nr:ABC transporter substrate-binding protein [Hamadaea tsunoensis]